MYIGDLHIHSRYSRATSRDCTPEHLDLWARRKGIHIVGTGDFTHPAWREELKEKLKPAEDGLYLLKDGYRIKEDPVPDGKIPRFVVTGEISSIYRKNGKTRKVHSLILLPGLEDAERISARLEPGGCGADLGQTGADRKYPFGRTAHPGAGLPGSAGDRSRTVPAGRLCAGAHLDAAFFHVRGILRF